MMILSLTLLLGAFLVPQASGQTFVQFTPDQNYDKGLPLAAGFAYAFHAPVSAAKSLDEPLNPYYIPISKAALEGDDQVRSGGGIGKQVAAAPKSAFRKNKKVPSVLKTQYHSQDELGQYAYGYVHNDASHHEERTADGGVSGSYSYYDNDGVKQSAKYKADRHGYRVEATNLPVEPLVSISHTPEVMAATQAHLDAVQNARSRHSFGIHAGIGDTPEVAAAKAAHLKAFNEIRERHEAGFRLNAHRARDLHNNPKVTHQRHKRHAGGFYAGEDGQYRPEHHVGAEPLTYQGGNPAYRQDDGQYRDDGREHVFDDGLYRPKNNHGAPVQTYHAQQAHQAPVHHGAPVQTYHAQQAQHSPVHQAHQDQSHIQAHLHAAQVNAAARAAHEAAFQSIKRDHQQRW